MDAELQAEMDALIDALRALGRLPPLAPLASDGAVLTLVPREEGLTPKDIPVDALFKKVVSIRDKLRVLEQRVNASGIAVDDKIALQAKITAAYAAIAGLVAFFSEDALPSAPLAEADRGADG